MNNTHVTHTQERKHAQDLICTCLAKVESIFVVIDHIGRRLVSLVVIKPPLLQNLNVLEHLSCSKRKFQNVQLRKNTTNNNTTAN
jgi:hypothetical protein